MEQNQKLFNLVEAAKKGDSSAFTELYNSSYGMVYTTCMGHLRNREDAEDTTQEVFIQVYNKLNTLTDNLAFYGWVKQIAIFLSINKFNRRHDNLSYDDAISSSELDGRDDNVETLPDTYVLREEKRKIIENIMRTELSEVQYQVLFMYYYDGLQIDAIARFLNCPEGTVKTRLKSAKVKIKDGIVKYEQKTGDHLIVNGAIPSIALVLRSSVNSMPVSIKPFSGAAVSKGLGIKIAASLLAVSVIGVGGVGAYHHLSSKNSAPKSKTKVEASTEEETNVIDNVDETDDVQLYAIGDTFTFGEYGGEAITWRVLDYQDGDYLVISEYVLDSKKYNDIEADITWETCTLRSWLNTDFYNVAFTADEQSHIVLTNVEAVPNEHVSTSAGNDTQDKVFVLDIYEAKRYFDTSKNRICNPTEYALRNGAHTNNSGASWWWLRSSGDTQSDVTLVYGDGTMDYGGVRVDDELVSVRPAMWVDPD